MKKGKLFTTITSINQISISNLSIFSPLIDQHYNLCISSGVSQTEQTNRIVDQLLHLEEHLIALTAQQPTWLLAVGHYPIYSNSNTGNVTELVKYLLPLLKRYKVHAFLCGHDHISEHLQIKDLELFVAGAGTMVDNMSKKSAAKLVWSYVGAAFAYIDATPTTLTVNYVDIYQTIQYAYTLENPFSLRTYTPTYQPTFQGSSISNDETSGSTYHDDTGAIGDEQLPSSYNRREAVLVVTASVAMIGLVIASMYAYYFVPHPSSSSSNLLGKKRNKKEKVTLPTTDIEEGEEPDSVDEEKRKNKYAYQHHHQPYRVRRQSTLTPPVTVSPMQGEQHREEEADEDDEEGKRKNKQFKKNSLTINNITLKEGNVNDEDEEDDEDDYTGSENDSEEDEEVEDNEDDDKEEADEYAVDYENDEKDPDAGPMISTSSANPYSSLSHSKNHKDIKKSPVTFTQNPLSSVAVSTVAKVASVMIHKQHQQVQKATLAQGRQLLSRHHAYERVENNRLPSYPAVSKEQDDDYDEEEKAEDDNNKEKETNYHHYASSNNPTFNTTSSTEKKPFSSGLGHGSAIDYGKTTTEMYDMYPGAASLSPPTHFHKMVTSTTTTNATNNNNNNNNNNINNSNRSSNHHRDRRRKSGMAGEITRLTQKTVIYEKVHMPGYNNASPTNKSQHRRVKTNTL
jgi:hypothetical protein